MRNHDSESTVGALAARPSRRDALIAGAALVAVPLVQRQTASAGGQTPSSLAGRTVGCGAAAAWVEHQRARIHGAPTDRTTDRRGRTRGQPIVDGRRSWRTSATN